MSNPPAHGGSVDDLLQDLETLIATYQSVIDEYTTSKSTVRDANSQTTKATLVKINEKQTEIARDGLDLQVQLLERLSQRYESRFPQTQTAANMPNPNSAVSELLAVSEMPATSTLLQMMLLGQTTFTGDETMSSTCARSSYVHH
jgi:hypothetical protein